MSDLELLLNHFPILFYIGLFVFGACIGSFINVVVYRLPTSLIAQWKNQCLEYLAEQEIKCDASPDFDTPTLSTPGSRCPKCLKPLRIFHNLPIVGYLLLAGKCAFCKQSISIRYPLVELITATLSILLGLLYAPDMTLVWALIFTYTIICLSLIDIDCQLLPDNIVLPLLWSGLLINTAGYFTDLKSAVLGAVFGYLLLWSIYQVHHRLTGKEGMGYGDFKLLAAIGAWFGWQVLPLVILIASFSGTIIAVIFILGKKQSKDIPISFGPYLAISSWLTMLWGDQLTQNYFHLFNL